ncbi:MAG: hypothetical protein F4X45_08585 [Chloroflexi bacterium]|nr:hypothetical protein [Chloroflexota bacterium]
MAQSVALTDLLNDNYWACSSIQNEQGFNHTAYGYETHLPTEVRDRLLQTDDPTALAIRFAPDYLVTQVAGSASEILKLEYKTTTTPRYSTGDRQWNIGQIEADPWEYYLRLRNAGERLALFIYCSFHSRPLLCDYPITEWQESTRQKVRATQTGSSTDYYNLDLTQLRTFSQFMAEEFGVHTGISDPLIRNVLASVQIHPLLQTRHDTRSPCHEDLDYATGFNWEIP